MNLNWTNIYFFFDKKKKKNKRTRRTFFFDLYVEEDQVLVGPLGIYASSFKIPQKWGFALLCLITVGGFILGHDSHGKYWASTLS